MKLKYLLTPGVEVSVNVELDQVCKAFPVVDVLQVMNGECRKLLKETTYFVEADSWTTGRLACEHQEKRFSEPIGTFTVAIGTLCDHDVTISLTFRKVGDKLICFYYMEGSYAIWPMAEEFIKAASPGTPKTNALNIHHIFS